MGTKKESKESFVIKNTEVKFLLREDTVLEEGFQLNHDFKRRFNISSDSAKMRIWYLDTPGQELNDEKWLVRYRYHEDYDLELTYKKRYSEGEYEQAATTDKGKRLMRQASPEVDMNLDAKTFSFAFTEKFPIKDRYKKLDLDEAKKLSIKRCPKALEHWMMRNWGFRHLRDAVLYGPISAMEYKGSYQGLDICIEIWRLDTYLPELSFDIKTKKAEEMRDKVRQVLQENEWLSMESILKTDFMFDHFGAQQPIQ